MDLCAFFFVSKNKSRTKFTIIVQCIVVPKSVYGWFTETYNVIRLLLFQDIFIYINHGTVRYGGILCHFFNIINCICGQEKSELN